MTQIDLRSVHKSYEHVEVINDVNLHIAAGEFCVFLGPSGCGKSTLLRMVAGLEPITAGDLHIGGQHMNDTPAAKRELAMVFQNYALYPHMSVYENMAFGPRQAKVNAGEIDRRVKEAAQILQISHLLDRLPKALSGGQRQRVAIGRAIVRKPNVFLFDEPLSNLDAALRVHMRTEIARLHREYQRASAIYVTHDQIEAMALADQIVLLRSGPDVQRLGSVAQTGSPMDLYHHPKNMFVAGFLGSPRMNFLPATVIASGQGEVTLQIQGAERVRIAIPVRAPAAGERVTVGIRPEHLVPAQGMGPATVTRRVSQVEHFGEYSYVYLEGAADGEGLIAKVIGHSKARCGDNETFSLLPAHCHLFDANGFALERLNG